MDKEMISRISNLYEKLNIDNSQKVVSTVGHSVNNLRPRLVNPNALVSGSAVLVNPSNIGIAEAVESVGYLYSKRDTNF